MSHMQESPVNQPVALQQEERESGALNIQLQFGSFVIPTQTQIVGGIAAEGGIGANRSKVKAERDQTGQKRVTRTINTHTLLFTLLKFHFNEAGP